MANFKTHLIVPANASGIAATGLYYYNQIEFISIPWFIFLGAIGGLLPDIDSDNSRALKILFNASAMLVSILFILAYKDQHSLQYLLGIALGLFIIVRYPLLAAFKYLTVHRGVFHSLLSAVFFILLTVYVSHHEFHHSRYISWINGLFIGFGFIIHLILDECYSVDLKNARLKRSFGTAFKLFSLNSLSASFIMFMATAVLYYSTPAYPFHHQEALTILNLALEISNSTLEKYFFKVTG